jgi:hypothetical protein
MYPPVRQLTRSRLEPGPDPSPRTQRREHAAGGGATRGPNAKERQAVMLNENGHGTLTARRARQMRVGHSATAVVNQHARVARGDGRVRPLTRAGVWVLLMLAAANGLFLYLLPGLADSHYAWSIKPPVNAAFIGAGFLAGTLATGLVLATATRWRTISTLSPALWVLASTLLTATIIHRDRFRWDYPPTWVWALVYGGVPLAIPFLVARQRRVAEAEPPADPALRLVRQLSGIVGTLLVAGAAALLAAPAELGEHWVWPLTPLLTRTVAAWYALFGTMLLTCAVALRRPAEAVIGYAALGAWSLLLLALPLLYPDDVNGGGLWIALMLVLLALYAYALRVALRDRERL